MFLVRLCVQVCLFVAGAHGRGPIDTSYIGTWNRQKMGDMRETTRGDGKMKVRGEAGDTDKKTI